MRLAELDSDNWLDDEDPLTVHERALLEARLAAYTKDPDAGSTWEEVEGRIRTRLAGGRTDERRVIVRPEPEADITDAGLWYDSREPGLGLKLITKYPRVSTGIKEP